MIKIDREDIQIISRHSNLSETSIDQLLKQNIYSDKASWNKFLKLFFISLGLGFTIAGILFFFAYNWADLHKFIKLGLVGFLIISSTLVAVFSKLSLDIKNILLLGASILVGVLFAVFGQIYQTGANAYDFFLGWTLFVAIWVAVSNFAPLWLLLILLINTTLILYSQQVAHDWSNVLVCALLFIINSIFLVVFLWGKEFIKNFHAPRWFTNTLALGATFFSTVGIVFGIFGKKEFPFLILFLLATLLYTAGIQFGLKSKNGFYLAIIPFSIIIIISSFLLELSDDSGMFFIISLFIIGSVTFVIKNLINLQKKWIN